MRGNFMNCKKCGFILEPNTTVCPNCGNPTTNNEVVNNQTVQGTQYNNEIPMKEAVAPVVQQTHREPIMPDAPEAPLPGTQKLPVVNPVTEQQVTGQQATEQVTSNNVVQPVVSNVTPVTEVPTVNSEPVNNNVTTQPPLQGAPVVDPTPTPKKKNKTLLLLIIVIVVIALAAVFFLAGGKELIMGKKTTNPTTTTTSTTTTSTTTTTTTMPVKQDLILDNVKIFVPNGYTISDENKDGVAIIVNTAQKTQINIAIVKQKFSEYDARFAELPAAFAEAGLTVTNPEQKDINGRRFLCFNVNVNGVDELLCFTNIRDDSIIRFDLVVEGITRDQAFEVFSEIAEFAVPQTTDAN